MAISQVIEASLSGLVCPQVDDRLSDFYREYIPDRVKEPVEDMKIPGHGLGFHGSPPLTTILPWTAENGDRLPGMGNLDSNRRGMGNGLGRGRGAGDRPEAPD